MLSRENAPGTEQAIGHPAVTDPLTGLANRLHFELVYSYFFAAGNRGVTFSVMLLSSGESTDEEHLRALGEKVERTTRDSDLVAHLGEGRYGVLLLGTNLQGARVAADRIEVATSDTEGPVSIGLAVYSPDIRDSAELLDAAERALQAAQTAGGGIEFG